MRRKIATLAAALLAAGGIQQAANAQAWSENFNNGIPATWTRYNVDGLTPAANVSFVNNAWVSRLRVAGDSCIVSTSWYNPAGTANDWIVSPSFTVTAGMFLRWEEFAPDVNYPDDYEVRLSTGGNTVADFTTTLYSGTGNSTGFQVKGVSLATYTGQTVRVAFRNKATDKFLLYIDNVNADVPPAADLELTSISPDANSSDAYGTVGVNRTISGTVVNNGGTAVTSYQVTYSADGGAAQTYTVNGNIPPFGTGSFTHNVPYSIAAVGAHNILVDVNLTGDVATDNDTMSTTITGVSFMPSKKIVAEEGTGTWCGYCVRGIVYMDSVNVAHGDDFSLVAVHNDDPMTVSAYDSWMGTQIGGYPSMVIDRVDASADPADLFSVWNAYKDKFAFATISLGNGTVSGGNYTLPVTVTPAIDMSGDYRLVMVLTEDDVKGTGSDWDQHNYYSDTYQNGGAGSLHSSEYNFDAFPDPVPAASINYDFVARSITPSPTGTANLPATMMSGMNYDMTFTAPVNSSWNQSKMRAVVMLLRGSDGAALNSNNQAFPLSVANTAASISELAVYPNPTRGQAMLGIDLKEATNLSISVMDATGRLVQTIDAGYVAAGKSSYTLNTTNLAAGLYTIKVQTTTGNVTKQLSVVK